jgi:uncharacterized protein DUF4145
MRVLTYIRRVLEVYAAGDQNHLSLTLAKPDPDPEQEHLYELIGRIEEYATAIARLLAGGRMVPDAVDSQTEELWIGKLQKEVKSVGELWAYIPKLDVAPPKKSDLIDIGIMHLILDRLESGIERISSLDLLSVVLPKRLTHLQTMFSEAHFNYLLGNRTAVAIMCRALLEESLKDKAPGRLTIDGDTKTLNDRLEEAKITGWLDDARTACAREIVRMGNLAVHDNTKLSTYSDLKIEELLINTRKILADLYS